MWIILLIIQYSTAYSAGSGSYIRSNTPSVGIGGIILWVVNNTTTFLPSHWRTISPFHYRRFLCHSEASQRHGSLKLNHGTPFVPYSVIYPFNFHCVLLVFLKINILNYDEIFISYTSRLKWIPAHLYCTWYGCCKYWAIIHCTHITFTPNLSQKLTTLNKLSVHNNNTSRRVTQVRYLNMVYWLKAEFVMRTWGLKRKLSERAESSSLREHKSA